MLIKMTRDDDYDAAVRAPLSAAAPLRPCARAPVLITPETRRDKMPARRCACRAARYEAVQDER